MHIVPYISHNTTSFAQMEQDGNPSLCQGVMQRICKQTRMERMGTVRSKFSS